MNMPAQKEPENANDAGMRPPNFRSAIQMLRSGLDNKISKIAELRSNIGEVWGKVEGYGVNRKAARTFRMLDKMEPKERESFMRNFNGLCDAAGWPVEEADIVDRAQDKTTVMRMVKTPPAHKVVPDPKIDPEQDLPKLTGAKDSEIAPATKPPRTKLKIVTPSDPKPDTASHKVADADLADGA